MKQSQKISTKIFRFIPLLLLLALTILLQPSCKKIDTEVIQAIAKNEKVTANFFKISANASSSLKRVAEELKSQNSEKEFLNVFAKKFGIPVWDKVTTQYGKEEKSNNYVSSSSSTNTSDITDTTIYIPLVLENDDHVNAFIIATVNSQVVMRIFRNSDYENFPFATTVPIASTTAEQFAIRMMMFDREVFGYSKFLLKDKRLFNNSNNYKDPANIYREVDFNNSANNVVASGFALNNVYITLCFTITTTTTTNHCPYPAGQCTGTGGSCDNCAATCANVTTTYSMQCETWSEDDGVGNIGGGSGSGSGSGGSLGGGGTPPPCPIMGAIVTNNAVPGCDPVPNPWPYVPPPSASGHGWNPNAPGDKLCSGSFNLRTSDDNSFFETNMIGLKFEDGAGNVNSFNAYYDLHTGMTDYTMNQLIYPSPYGTGVPPKSALDYLHDFYPEFFTSGDLTSVWENGVKIWRFSKYAAQKIANRCSNTAGFSVRLEYPGLCAQQGFIPAQTSFRNQTDALIKCFMPTSVCRQQPSSSTNNSYASFSPFCN